jgi:hypothetical protein
MKGQVLEHTLGFMATVVELDPARESDSHYTSSWAYCRYHHIKNGELEIRTFAIWEFKQSSFTPEQRGEEEEDD